MNLRVENVIEGLVLAWNRIHPSFPVKVGDIISRVNDKKGNAAAMIEELQHSIDVVRMTVHRTPASGSRSASKGRSISHNLAIPAGEATMLPGPDGAFSAASLVKPDGVRRPSKG